MQALPDFPRKRNTTPKHFIIDTAEKTMVFNDGFDEGRFQCLSVSKQREEILQKEIERLEEKQEKISISEKLCNKITQDLIDSQKEIERLQEALEKIKEANKIGLGVGKAFDIAKQALEGEKI